MNQFFDNNAVIQESANMREGVHTQAFITHMEPAPSSRTGGYPGILVHYASRNSDGAWETAEELVWTPTGEIVTEKSKLVARLCAASGIQPKVGVKLATLRDFGPVIVEIKIRKSEQKTKSGRVNEFDNSDVNAVMPRTLIKGEALPDGLALDDSGALIQVPRN